MEFDYTKEPGRVLNDKIYNKKEKPLVSIITPYYNASKYFEQTYNSVLNQTFPWYEWIIVNDGSTEYISQLEKLVSKDERIRLVNKENGGLSSARNRGIKESTTDIIIPLDADDLIEETYVEKIYFGLYFNKQASFAYTDTVGFQGQEYLWRKEFDSEKMKTENLLVCTAGIRKKDIEEVEFYDEIKAEFNEDWRFWLKLISKNKYPVHIRDYGFWYRRNDGMLNRIKSDKEKLNNSKKLIQEIADKIKEKVEAIEYPVKGEYNKFNKPQKLDWKLKTYEKKEKTRILLIIPWMVMGGADLFNLELVKKIDKEKYEISIITTVYSENNWKQKFKEYTQDIFELPNFLDIKNYSQYISYFIQSRDIDTILLSNSYYGYYLIPWIRKEYENVSIIDYVHMEEWYWRSGGYGRTSGILGEVIEKTYVCNGKTRQVLIENFGRKEETVETLYIGADKDKYDESKVEEGKIRREFDIQDKKIILFPCRIHPQKRPFMMLEIAKEIEKKSEDIVFVVVGDGPQLEEMKQESKKKGLEKLVYFAGRQDNMLPYYKDAKITLICSLKEGLSLTAYESLSMKTPVISSDVGGQKELINEKVGRIIPLYQDEEKDLDKREFEEKEIQEYVKAIEDILKDEDRYKKMREESRKIIEEKFSTDIMIERLEKEIEKTKKEERVEERREISKKLREFSNIIDDYLAIYCEFENFEKHIDVIWRDVLWFKGLYEGELSKNIYNKTSNNLVEKTPVLKDESDYIKISKEQYENYNMMSNKLEHIYSMRTWKLISKYRKFMDETKIGELLRKIRNNLIKNKI